MADMRGGDFAAVESVTCAVPKFCTWDSISPRTRAVGNGAPERGPPGGCLAETYQIESDSQPTRAIIEG